MPAERVTRKSRGCPTTRVPSSWKLISSTSSPTHGSRVIPSSAPSLASSPRIRSAASAARSRRNVKRNDFPEQDYGQVHSSLSECLGWPFLPPCHLRGRLETPGGYSLMGRAGLMHPEP